MKIYYATLFFCENLIARINAYENPLIDEYHISEFDRTFQNKKKGYEYKSTEDLSNIRYHKVHLNALQSAPMGTAGKIRCYPYRFTSHGILTQPQWHNDGLQRNIAQAVLNPDDGDIVILSDVDEMILNEYFDELVKLTLEKQIITIKLYFTMFYFNLYSTNWGGHPIIRTDCF